MAAALAPHRALAVVFFILQCFSTVPAQEAPSSASEAPADSSQVADFVAAAAAAAQEASTAAEVVDSWEASPFELSALLLELEMALGKQLRTDVEARIAPIEAHLEPKFTALGKNEHGNLGHPAVRYMLHRYFVQQRGWVVKGLDTGGQAWNISSPVELLRGEVPDSAVDIFARRLEGRGFGLRDAAAFAATLESLVQSETEATMRSIYTLLNMSQTATVNASDVDKALDTYMAALIMQVNLRDLSAKLDRKRLQQEQIDQYLESLRAELGHVWPAWTKTKGFLRDLRVKATPTQAPGAAPVADEKFSFATVLTIMAQVLERWGRWRFFECKDIKSKLLDIEDKHSGCVRLADFYRSNTEKGVWQFAESRAYLREQGILDESDPQDPHLIVPNYLNAQGNCLATSRYYSVCCLNECEDLLDNIEHSIEAPEATPERIVEVVSESLKKHPAAFMGVLGFESMQLLRTIADMHGGVVPLHGRLFAQWMHRVYPRECPYPHAAGAYKQLSLWDYEASRMRAGESYGTGTITRAEALDTVKNLTSQQNTTMAGATGATCAPWKLQEELVVPQWKRPKTMAELEEDADLWSALGCLSLLTASVAAGIILWRTVRDTSRVVRARGQPLKPPQRYPVQPQAVPPPV
eukprot:TRINITY_DN6145_c0_g2_i1.p1 TRINITY_DN6145_c0_g2~~TRINITY_DN6145_c0_g2_i1.p1  ORF type:complete len:639 (-),score=158.27 TRINITY_DN6145_c0_g2_i1:148-2064(-)